MNKRFREIFSNNLRYYMKIKGVTRKELADNTGIAYTTIRDYEKGICYAKMEKIEKIAVELDIPTYKLTDAHDTADIMNIIDNSEDSKLMLETMTYLEKLSKEKKQYILNTIKMIYNDMQ